MKDFIPDNTKYPTSPAFKNLAGNEYGRLTVVSYAGSKKKRTYWLCECSCGNSLHVIASNLLRGNTGSCGCLGDESRKTSSATHGMSGNPEFNVWAGMKQRCYDKNSNGYHKYGGRGITVCDEWVNDFAAFYSYMGERPSPNHSIDRIENNGNYEPGNVRWATAEEQCQNRRSNRLSPEVVAQARKLYSSGIKTAEIASMLDIDASLAVIRFAVQRKTWRNIE